MQNPDKSNLSQLISQAEAPVSNNEVNNRLEIFQQNIKNTLPEVEFVYITEDHLSKEPSEISSDMRNISTSLGKEYIGLIPSGEETTLDIVIGEELEILDILKNDSIAAPKIKGISENINHLETQILKRFFTHCLERTQRVFEEAAVVELSLQENTEKISLYPLWEEVRKMDTYLVVPARDVIALRKKLGHSLTEQDGKKILLQYYSEYSKQRVSDHGMLIGSTNLFLHGRADLMEIALKNEPNGQEVIDFFAQFMNGILYSTGFVLKERLQMFDNDINYDINHPADMILKALESITFIARAAQFILSVLEK